jgi:hypothetical protein
MKAAKRGLWAAKNANQDVKHRVVAGAWKAAGYPGEIKSSLFYLVKNKMGLAPGKRGRPRKTTAAPNAPDAKVGAGLSEAASIYREIESELDGLVRRAIEVKDHSLVEKLLAARRRASIKLV